jgi:hypothetical protein
MVRISLKAWVQREHERMDNLGWAFIDGFCIGTLLVCLFVSQYMLSKLNL